MIFPPLPFPPLVPFDDATGMADGFAFGFIGSGSSSEKDSQTGSSLVTIQSCQQILLEQG